VTIIYDADAGTFGWSVRSGIKSGTEKDALHDAVYSDVTAPVHLAISVGSHSSGGIYKVTITDSSAQLLSSRETRPASLPAEAAFVADGCGMSVGDEVQVNMRRRAKVVEGGVQWQTLADPVRPVANDSAYERQISRLMGRELAVGDKVCVKREITKPTFGWGIDELAKIYRGRRAVGTLTSVDDGTGDGALVVVEFKGGGDPWTAPKAEVELAELYSLRAVTDGNPDGVPDELWLAGAPRALLQEALGLGTVLVQHWEHGPGYLLGWKHAGVRVGDTSGGLSRDGVCRVLFYQRGFHRNVHHSELWLPDTEWNAMANMCSESDVDTPLELTFNEESTTTQLNKSDVVVPCRGRKAIMFQDEAGRTPLHWAILNINNGPSVQQSKQLACTELHRLHVLKSMLEICPRAMTIKDNHGQSAEQMAASLAGLQKNLFTHTAITSRATHEIFSQAHSAILLQCLCRRSLVLSPACWMSRPPAVGRLKGLRSSISVTREFSSVAKTPTPPPLRFVKRKSSSATSGNSFFSIVKLQTYSCIQLQKTWRQHMVIASIDARQREMAETRQAHFVKQRQEQQEASRQAIRSQRKTRDFERVLKLDKAAMDAYTQYMCTLGAVVGLQPLKEFIRQRVADFSGRRLLKEKAPLRHMLVCGELGTGKDMSADFAFQLFKVVGAIEKRTHGVPKAGSVDRRCMFFIVLAKWTDTDEEKDELLQEILAADSIAVLMGPETEVVGTASMLPIFKKHVPWTVLLPTLGSAELAEITFRMVRESGYILRRAGGSLDEMNLPMMEFIVRQTHDAALIRERNAYLANDMLERAISRKNDRLDESESRFAARLSLTPHDFGVEMESEEQIQARRQAVDAEIGRQIGWSGEGGPKEIFDRIRRQIELVNQGGDASVMEVNWNMVITGNPGTGKTTLARVIYTFFRAYGVLSKDVFEERNGLELKGEYVGQTAPKVQAMFKAAMGGCLFLDEAYSLADGEGGSDVFAKEAVRTMLTEVENNRTSILVVLAGYKDKMSKLMRADPGLPRRFPNVVHLADYSPAEIAAIALSKLQEKEPPMVCEDGLLEALAQHVEEKHAHECVCHDSATVHFVCSCDGCRQ
jgi:hypothetical protein